jgi:hypothetical protein
MDARRDDNAARLIAHLGRHPCVDCGETDPVVLLFDHQGDKTQNVSRILSAGGTWAEVMSEVAKCEVRCANCHWRRHARERRRDQVIKRFLETEIGNLVAPAGFEPANFWSENPAS